MDKEPVYESTPAKYSAEQVIKILLDPQKDKICMTKHSRVSNSSTYVVDIRNLEDIKKDQLGIWNYSGSHPQVYKVFSEENGRKSIEK